MAKIWPYDQTEMMKQCVTLPRLLTAAHNSWFQLEMTGDTATATYRGHEMVYSKILESFLVVIVHNSAADCY